MQKLWKDRPETYTSNVLSGTFLIPAPSLLWNTSDFDYAALLKAQPVDRFGCILVYRGTFDLAGARALRFTFRAMDAEYSSQPDLPKAAEYLTRSLEIRPTTYYRWIELGNVQLKRGLRDDALLAYERAKTYAPVGDEIVGPLTDQIRRVSRDDLSSVPILRNPKIE